MRYMIPTLKSSVLLGQNSNIAAGLCFCSSQMPNALEAYCVFMAFDLRLTVSSFVKQLTTVFRITNQGECWVTFQSNSWPQRAVTVTSLLNLVSTNMFYVLQPSQPFVCEVNYGFSLVIVFSILGVDSSKKGGQQFLPTVNKSCLCWSLF